MMPSRRPPARITADTIANQSLVSFATRHLHPYRSRVLQKGFDCSTVDIVFNQWNVALPHSSAARPAWGKVGTDNAKPGDLIFFKVLAKANASAT